MSNFLHCTKDEKSEVPNIYVLERLKLNLKVIFPEYDQDKYVQLYFRLITHDQEIYIQF